MQPCKSEDQCHWLHFNRNRLRSQSCAGVPNEIQCHGHVSQEKGEIVTCCMSRTRFERGTSNESNKIERDVGAFAEFEIIIPFFSI